MPAELYDAAEVDGASVWSKVWHVTMPQLRGVLFITLILQILGTAQVFLEPFLFTNGGPNHATETIMLRVYNLAFANLGNNYGQATALSLMLAVFLACCRSSTSAVTKPWSSTRDPRGHRPRPARGLVGAKERRSRNAGRCRPRTGAAPGSPGPGAGCTGCCSSCC